MNKIEKKRYIKAAQDLHYSEAVLSDIEKATTEDECVKIMHEARTHVK